MLCYLLFFIFHFLFNLFYFSIINYTCLYTHSKKKKTPSGEKAALANRSDSNDSTDNSLQDILTLLEFHQKQCHSFNKFKLQAFFTWLIGLICIKYEECINDKLIAQGILTIMILRFYKNRQIKLSVGMNDLNSKVLNTKFEALNTSVTKAFDVYCMFSNHEKEFKSLIYEYIAKKQ